MTTMQSVGHQFEAMTQSADQAVDAIRQARVGRRFGGLRKLARRLLEESYEIRTIQARQGRHAHQS